jgi:hypothetical protein
MKKLSLKNMKRSRRIGLIAVVFLAATAILGGTAYASSVVLTAGTLTINTPTVGNFGGVTLNGTAQDTNASVGTFTVTDATGSGSGWNVTVQASQFATGAPGNHTLPLSSISMTAPSVAKIDSSSGNAPSITADPYVIDSGSAVKISSAAADGTGMGSYTFGGTTLTLHVLANAYAGTYTSTVTVSVISGPGL